MMKVEAKKTVKETATGICEKLGDFFSLLCRNTMIISDSKDQEVFRMPLAVFAVIAFMCINISIPVILISLFCGVEYTFSGVDFANSTKVTFR